VTARLVSEADCFLQPLPAPTFGQWRAAAQSVHAWIRQWLKTSVLVITAWTVERAYWPKCRKTNALKIKIPATGKFLCKVFHCLI